jgi:hypothetical protein
MIKVSMNTIKIRPFMFNKNNTDSTTLSTKPTQHKYLLAISQKILRFASLGLVFGNASPKKVMLRKAEMTVETSNPKRKI